MKTFLLFSLILWMLLSNSCSRSEFLDERPQKSIIIPNTLEHYQRILDYDATMNGAATRGVTPQLGESGSDNFYLSSSDLNSAFREQMRNYYLWNKQPYVGESVTDWELPYKAVLSANTVLVGLDEFEKKNGISKESNFIRGQALFHRGYMFHQLSQVFAYPYKKDQTNNEPGIILRLEADINEKLSRATVEETYNRIVMDVKKSINLLDESPLHKARPSKQAAFALMARIYLSMSEYNLAKNYADSCLSLENKLYDFNLVNFNLQSPFQGIRFENPINQEVIYFSAMLSEIGVIYPTNPFFAKVDSNLFKEYQEGDLRKKIFFQKYQDGYRFKGSYSFVGYEHYFTGLAVDEILLIRAECNARLGDFQSAVIDMDKLLRARWDKNIVYNSASTLDDELLLEFILKERRKELLFRGLRWSDLRRFNIEGRKITLTRIVGNEQYDLLPTDSRWVWPLPLEVIVN
ncbi:MULTISPECIES: RagB/SusD family nutrient uptake outer membrane protein [Sphingobacterium]|uniref:RagB/SusD family nutrient uptake outer membrane protein n=1 Tax=Sphingobacterium TaxID=28453 RepID=UPI0012300F98|nr:MULTISPECIES: RagB/SusD family nutrient uptake outer membrane protein [Sphingobacterium]